MKRHFLPIFLIAVISIALYSNTLNNGFVYDDESSIVKNILIKDLSNLPKLFKVDYFVQSGEVTYRPVVTFTYFLDYAFYGLNPWGFHLTNLLLHAINGILLYIFAILLIRPHTLGGKQPKHFFANQPLLIALLFVTHPVLTEAVNAISFREDLLAFLFYIVTLCLYLQLRTSTSANCKSILYAISCTAYSLALLSKEMAITLPLIVYCYEWTYLDRNKKLHTILSNRYNVGYIAITFVYTYLRFYHFRDPREAGFQGWEFAERLFTMPYLLLSNLKLTLFPVSLSADYEIAPVTSLFSLQFMLTSIIIIFLTGISFKIMEWKKEASYGMLFYIITLSPVYNIIPIAFPLAERYLYLPAAGFCIATVSIFLPKSKGYNLYPIILFFAIFSIFFLGVINRNTVWRDNISLWHDAIVKMPNSSHSHLSLGLAYQEKGLFEKAITHYKTALKLKPDYTDAYNNLGNIYLDQRRYEEAIWHFNSALNYRPNVTSLHNNLGLAYYETGQVEKAILHYKIALNLNSNYSDAHNNLGSAYVNQGKIEEAVKEYRTAIMLDPLNARARNNLGLILVNQQKFDEAIQEYHNAIKIEPTLMEARYNLGIAYLKTGLKSKARMELETALKIKPDFAQARRALASIDSEKNQ